jgi:small conductance mechanosensitive channel
VGPNGEVKTLSNRSKDFSYYVFTIGMPYENDLDAVSAAIVEAGASLMQDPAFRPHILAPIEVYGIDDFQPGQLIIKGRIKTVPLKQWMVGRELRKRIAAVFKERHIELPVPHMAITLEKRRRVET